VEMVRPEGVPVPKPVEQPTEPVPQTLPRITPAQDNKPEFKSLIDRIISKIRSI
jgi:hypothetical protein